MEYPRIILLAALVIVGMILWNEWQKEYQPPVTQATTTPNQQAQGTNTNTPTIPTTNPTAISVPSKPTSVAPSQSQPQPQTPANIASSSDIPEQRIVTVKTDVLNVQIDTLGGNIIGTSLPQYPQTLKNPDQPVVLLSAKPEQFYIVQSALVSELGPDTKNALAQYQADSKHYELADGQNTLTVTLHWTNPQGIVVNKVFKFNRNEYLVNVGYQITNNSSQAWQGNLYNQITRKDIKPQGSSLLQIHPYTGAAYSTQDERYQELSFKTMTTKPLDQVVKGGWVSMVQHYFLTAWIPDTQLSNNFYSKQEGPDVYTVGIASPTLTVAPKQTITTNSKLYMGPELTDKLKAIAPGLDLTVSYGWLWPISVFIFWLMKNINHVVNNWGWSIIAVTLLIKILFYPLSSKSFYSMANMRKLSPKIEALRERFANDKQKLTQATMELYKKEKVNPLSGCLPIVIQIPVFFALYMVLVESVELRQAPWILWINDLSSPDPFYVLPVLMGITMFIQQRLNPPPPDPTQAKMMMLLPFVFTFVFMHFPSGLVLYWVVNNALQILQQWYVMNKFEQAYSRRVVESK